MIGESGSGKSMLGCALLEMVPVGCLITKGSIVHHFNSNKRISKIRGVHIAMISQDPMQAVNPLEIFKTQFTIIMGVSLLQVQVTEMIMVTLTLTSILPQG